MPTVETTTITAAHIPFSPAPEGGGEDRLSLRSSVAVDLASVPKVDDDDQEPAVIHGVDHSVVADPNSKGAAQPLQRDRA